MGGIVTSRKKKDKTDKLSVNHYNILDDNKFFVNFGKPYSNTNFLGDYFVDNNNRMANSGYIKILHICSTFSSNGFSNFSIMSQYNRVTNVADFAFIAWFILFAKHIYSPSL